MVSFVHPFSNIQHANVDIQIQPYHVVGGASGKCSRKGEGIQIQPNTKEKCFSRPRVLPCRSRDPLRPTMPPIDSPPRRRVSSPRGPPRSPRLMLPTTGRAAGPRTFAGRSPARLGLRCPGTAVVSVLKRKTRGLNYPRRLNIRMTTLEVIIH